MKLDEAMMLDAVEQSCELPFEVGDHAIVISPTRGMQLARSTLNQNTQKLVWVRVGGPRNFYEETPDVLDDAKPFMVVEYALELIIKLRGDHTILRGQVLELEQKVRDLSPANDPTH